MAITAFSQWSTTAALNVDLNSIPLDGASMLANQVDDAFREMMSQLVGAGFVTATATLTVTSTDAGAAVGPVLDLYRNSATPAASDIIGKVIFNGEDSAGNTQEYASIESLIVDATSTSEDGKLDFYATRAGSRTKFVSISANDDWVEFPRGQIKFPATQNASSDANALDDYEEGTFTPAVNFGGGTTGITYGSRSGSYTKIGNLVVGTINFVMTSKGSSTGNAAIGTLPFAPVADSPVVVYLAGGAVFASLVVGGMDGVIGGGGTSITLRQPNTTGSTGVTDANFTNTSSMSVSFSYTV
jgi:hypothetical protein